MQACRRALAATRYVDDVLALTRSLCPGCVTKWVLAMHDGVPFEEEHSTAKSKALPWLDVRVHMERWPPAVWAAEPERPWLEAPEGRPARFRVPPWLGARDELILRGFVRGKLARWDQVRMDAETVLRALKYEWELWQASGWPAVEVARSWRRHAGGHRLTPLVIPYIVSMAAQLAGRRGKRPGNNL